jgi:hypothetical protein
VPSSESPRRFFHLHISPSRISKAGILVSLARLTRIAGGGSSNEAKSSLTKRFLARVARFGERGSAGKLRRGAQDFSRFRVISLARVITMK